MILEELKKSISQMSTEELQAKILELRASRRMKKEKPAVKKAAAKADASMDKLLDGLSLEQKRKLAALLGGQ
ncbi:MAG: hypothetical protein QMD92_00070 [bacterium]|nr:hypothetical protein [bacterium]